MEILNDLTQCNFYYYILGGNTTFNKSYLIFNYLQFNKNFKCIGDAFIRRQNIKLDNIIIRFLNKNLKQQYYFWKKFKQLKTIQSIDLNQKLIKFSQSGYLLIIQYLINHTINNFLSRKYGVNIHADNEYALRRAAQYGHLPVVQYLVIDGADIHAVDDYALYYAAQNGHLPVVQYLLQPHRLNNFLNRKYEGADIHAADDQALISAIRKSRLNIVQYLVSKGANIHADNDRALGYAALKGHLNIVQYLLSLGANPAAY